MSGFRIHIQNGTLAQPLVDPFYEKNGSQGRARAEDTFFLAMDDTNLIGCVRYCIEDRTSLLRTMMIDQNHRRQGIGLALLQAFASFLESKHIQNVYCLPYAHLEVFYGHINFQKIDPKETPLFLADRLENYLKSGKSYLCLRRP